MKFNLALEHWHIEPSSRCTLKCPRCPRGEVSESLLNRQLTLQFFKEQIGENIIKNIKKITFCGNDGDPIYCTELLDIILWIKTINTDISLVIITNGSYKSVKWWADLAALLDHRDEINWSLDGWDQVSNEQYRVNCNWDSIQSGINTFFENNNSTYRVWSAIGFLFNQDHITDMIETAKKQGFDLFQLTKSTKFGSKYPNSYDVNDKLEPTDLSLIASGHRFERDLFELSKKVRASESLKPVFAERVKELKNSAYSGICLIGNKGVFLNSRGEFYPCCWTANRYQHNNDWLKKAEAQFNLNTRDFTKIQNDKFWSTDFLTFRWQECQTKCTPDRLNDESHVLDW
jgi:MoaA/NifB/PqqE/SkfB family radical SAM enzyme